MLCLTFLADLCSRVLTQIHLHVVVSSAGRRTKTNKLITSFCSARLLATYAIAKEVRVLEYKMSCLSEKIEPSESNTEEQKLRGKKSTVNDIKSWSSLSFWVFIGHILGKILPVSWQK